MDKIAMYKERIEKEAARAWKREYGNLSDENQAKLKSNGTLDHERELKGLNKGTDNIIKKHNIHVAKDTKDMGKRISSVSKGNKLVNAGMKSMGSKNVKKDVTNLVRESMHQSGNNYSWYDAEKKKGIISKGKMSRLGNPDLNETYRKHIKSDLGNRYSDAIAHRHEVDEITTSERAANKKRTTVKFEGKRYPATSFAVHTNPKVIVRESTNVATAPKETKNFYKELRGTGGESSALGSVGHTYGYSGAYDKKSGRLAENGMAKLNKPTLSNMLKNAPKTSSIKDKLLGLVKKIKMR